MSESAFEKWFVEQHGGTRESQWWSESDHELEQIVLRGDAAKRELERRREWGVRHTSALYAWQAREHELKKASG